MPSLLLVLMARKLNDSSLFLFCNISSYLTPSKFLDLSAEELASVLSAEALDSTFLSSNSAKSKSLTLTAFRSLETGAREVWAGLMGRTMAADNGASSQCLSVIPENSSMKTLYIEFQTQNIHSSGQYLNALTRDTEQDKVTKYSLTFTTTFH